MGYKTWLYHNQHGAKIFDSDEVPELEKQGWRDSPKKLAVEAVREETDAKNDQGQICPECGAGPMRGFGFKAHMRIKHGR